MKFQQKLSEDVWKETYKWDAENIPLDMWKRIATDLAKPEDLNKRDEVIRAFLEILSDWCFVPGGRIQSNAGLNLKGTTMINCFVGGFSGKNQDSIEGIFRALGEQAKTLKSEGGYGFCIDVLRPDGAYVEGIANASPGGLAFADIWDTSSAVVTRGSVRKKEDKGKKKIRKGAQMITNSVWHPGIKSFITAKLVPGKLTKFNMSALVTNKFMDAVKKDKDWDLIFPDTTHEKYDDEWDGNIEKWKSKYPKAIVVYETLKARELWDLIMTATYTRNDPGVIFIDRVNELNNLYYMEYINATNPCGEQPLPLHGSCNLGSINLTQYVKGNDFDYEKLKKHIPAMVRFQDNVNDVSNFPLKEQKEQAKQKRRIGIGYLGYGSALYLMKLAYGSEEALKKTDKLCRFVANEVYRASAYLAKEKGSFPALEKELYLKSKFLKILDDDVIELIKKHGVRCALHLMTAPTGNTGIEANNVSGGLEPVVSPEYIRTLIVSEIPDGLFVPIVNWTEKTFTCDGEMNWKWTKEGDESILFTTFNDTVYKFDRNRGLVREEKVFDYAVLNMPDFDINAPYAKTINNLTVKEHIDTMKVFAKYIDAAISKTINLPNDYPYEDFKNIYMEAFDSGYIKGFTTYRWGTMTSVISTESTADKKDEQEFKSNHAPKRPKTLDCDIFKVTVQGEKWIVFVGLLNNRPYEVFAGKIDLVDIPNSVKSGKIIKSKKGQYQLEHDSVILISDLASVFKNDVHDNITRLVSTSLRHGAEVKFVVEQLNKAHGVITNFSKSLSRALKNYIQDGEKVSAVCQSCGSNNVVFQEGCFKCLDCGSSKCG